MMMADSLCIKYLEHNFDLGFILQIIVSFSGGLLGSQLKLVRSFVELEAT